jgi:hypothetical protein
MREKICVRSRSLAYIPRHMIGKGENLPLDHPPSSQFRAFGLMLTSESNSAEGCQSAYGLPRFVGEETPAKFADGFNSMEGSVMSLISARFTWPRCSRSMDWTIQANSTSYQVGLRRCL